MDHQRAITDSERKLLDLIGARTGISFREFQWPLFISACSEACDHFGCDGTDALLHELAAQVQSSAMFDFIMARITNGESYFFRHHEQMQLLRGELIPEMIARKQRQQDFSLRIWSAGCSSGQEIYSIAILLYEILPDIDRWALNLLGTDINKYFLENAVRGCYTDWSLRETPASIRDKYFGKVNDDYQISEKIRQQVNFSYLNLAEEGYPSLLMGTYAVDIVLCRNVLFYLERNVRSAVMVRLAECLAPNGILLLGPSDFFDAALPAFDAVQNDKTRYFRLAGNLPELPLCPEASVSLATPMGAGDKREPVKPIIGAGGNPMTQLLDLMQIGQWRDALALAGKISEQQGESLLLLQMEAKIQANLGYIAEALQLCEKCLRLDPVDKHIYLLQGIMLMADARFREAEQALRRAVFLDYQFAEAHYQLGLLLIHQNCRQEGLKSLASALMHAQGKPYQCVHNASGMTYARFAEIIESEIEIYAESSAM
ncbi:MAG: hypothetical protein LZF61_05265 [Nitrosomonas sp.]|nr:MAG: hypothetical protein LZF61_05265 [Nitrosomonas sp.]